MNLRIEPTKKAKDLLYKLERKKAFRDQFESATAFIEFSLEQALIFMTNTRLEKSKGMLSFEEYCRQLDEKNSAADKLEVAYKKKQREKKIKKLLAIDSHWSGLN